MLEDSKASSNPAPAHNVLSPSMRSHCGPDQDFTSALRSSLREREREREGVESGLIVFSSRTSNNETSVDRTVWKKSRFAALCRTFDSGLPCLQGSSWDSSDILAVAVFTS